MFPELQLTFIEEDQAVRDAWFPVKGAVKSRPDIIKMEVGAPAGLRGPRTYVVFIWFQEHALRFTLKAGEPSEAVYAISRTLEEWWNTVRQTRSAPTRF